MSHDHFNTPEHILRAVRDFGDIRLDPCSNQWSSVCASVSIDATLGSDGLAADWRLSAGNCHDVVYVNPPYSDPLPWVLKACKTSFLAPDINIIMLVNWDHSTEWFQSVVGKKDDGGARAACLLRRRVRFGEYGKPAKSVNPKPSVLFYWGPSPFRFQVKCLVHQLGVCLPLRDLVSDVESIRV